MRLARSSCGEFQHRLGLQHVVERAGRVCQPLPHLVAVVGVGHGHADLAHWPSRPHACRRDTSRWDSVAMTSSSGGPPGLAGSERPQRQEHAVDLHRRVRQQGARDEVALRLPDGLHGAAKLRHRIAASRPSLVPTSAGTPHRGLGERLARRGSGLPLERSLGPLCRPFSQSAAKGPSATTGSGIVTPSPEISHALDGGRGGRIRRPADRRRRLCLPVVVHGTTGGPEQQDQPAKCEPCPLRSSLRRNLFRLFRTRNLFRLFLKRSLFRFSVERNLSR